MTENGIAPAPPDDDRTPTQQDEAPPIKPAEQWVMPEPVFRRSDGYTPRASVGNEDPTITPDSITTLEVDTDSADGPAADAAAIAEQPDFVTEEPADASAEPIAVPAKKKGGFLRILLIILGLALIIGGLIIAGAMVVLWYYSQIPESQNLN
jgi:hypothetical protein